VVSELLTNALRHALPAADEASTALVWPIRLGLLHPGPYVVCAVADPSAQLPVPRTPGAHEESGRGLMVIASLSDRWGYCAAPAERGKVVWAAFATTARPY
jgi:two-component sensor histidine kinase